MSAVENVAGLLDAAADLIVKNGWTQNHFEHDGCFCLDGAIQYVKGSGDTLVELSCIREAVGCSGAIAWNDEPGRTKAEVVSALRKAAALARQEQAA